MSKTKKESADSQPTPGTRDGTATAGSRVLQGCLALGLAYTLFLAKSLLVPIVAALLISLLLSPLVTLLKKIHVPRTISALLLLSALLGPLTFLGIELARPAEKWVKLMPELLSQVTTQIDSISAAIQSEDDRLPAPTQQTRMAGEPILPVAETTMNDDGTAKVEEENVVTERIKRGGLEVIVSMLAAAPQVIAQLLTAIILTLFLLIFGPGLFVAFITGFSRGRDKQQVISLVGTIQVELSRYIVTVSIINVGLALSTGLILWLLGVEDALLWGVLGGVLNFAPYVGTLITVCVLGLAGLEQYGMVFFATVPLLVYLALNLCESQFITPTVLGRHMLLNPLILMFWLLLWGWLWGMVGVLLAVPLLVSIKLIAGKLEIGLPWIRLVETKA